MAIKILCGKSLLKAVDSLIGFVEACAVWMQKTRCILIAAMIELGWHREQGQVLAQTPFLVFPWPWHRQWRMNWSSFVSLLGGTFAHQPVPMMNIINGGAHADNPIDFQNS